MESKISRRDFLKLIGLGAATTAVLTGCVKAGIRPNFSSPTPEYGFSDGGPSLPFFLAMTGLQPEQIKGFEYIIADPDQRANFMKAIVGNQQSVNAGGIVTNQAIFEGRAIQVVACGDARVKTMAQFSAIVMDQHTQDAVNYWVVENRQIGAQPALTKQGINKGLYFTHESLAGCGTGCGFLGGVEQYLIDGNADALIKHGVPPDTIRYIDAWKRNYGAKIDFQRINMADDAARQWSRIGAEVNSYINAMYHGQEFWTVYGIQSHATGEFEILGAVNDLGQEIKDLSQIQKKLPELYGAAEFLNKPHPAIEALAGKQRPNANVLSISNHSPQGLFGDDFIKPGETFVINRTAGELTPQALDDLLAGSGYSLGALPQGSNTMYLVADSAEEMTQLRQKFLGSSFADDFLKRGGLIVEFIPDQQGLFQRTVAIRSLEDPLRYITLSAEEEALTKNGVRKIVGAISVTENITGETMLVRIQSTVDGKIYDVPIPKGSAYSAITAEVLERAGLPAVEALWYEKALVKFGGFLGKAGLMAGLLWMAYDGLKWYTDVMGLGNTVQINEEFSTPQITGDGIKIEPTNSPEISDDLFRAIYNLGLSETPANKVYEGSDIYGIEKRLINRVISNKSERELGVQNPTTPDYFIRLDDSLRLGIPFVASDSQKDIATSIQVIPTARLGPDNYSIIIDYITYRNTANGEEMIFSKQWDGTFSQISGPPSLKFNTIIENPKSEGQYLSIPLKFSYGVEGREVIEPNYEPQTLTKAKPSRKTSNKNKPTPMSGTIFNGKKGISVRSNNVFAQRSERAELL